MAETDKTERMPFRLAFRVEGDDWRCYLADAGHMKGAFPLGSIVMRAARDPAIKAAFMALMRQTFEKMSREVLGIEPVWGEPEPGPEHERGKEKPPA